MQNKIHPQNSPQKWQPFLECYEELSLLQFSEISERDRAISLLWGKRLRGLPHTTPDGMSLVIPSEAVVCFQERNITFTLGKAVFSRDVSPKVLTTVRKNKV